MTQCAGGLRRTTSTTAPTMNAPPANLAGVSRSFRMSVPSRTAITGFTYAEVATVVVGRDLTAMP
jgi:hypothetical protein